jgi:hypothetical protein
VGPEVVIGPGESFESYRTFELVHDRRSASGGTAVRRMYRTIAPWVTENPVDYARAECGPGIVKLAIEQSAQVGFSST